MQLEVNLGCCCLRVEVNDSFVENDQLFGYGANSEGQLGVGDALNKRNPVVLDFSGPVASIACGDTYTWFVTTSGLMLSGFGSTSIREVDTATVEGSIVTAAARHSTMALLSNNGQVYTYSSESGKFFQSTLCEATFTSVACGETHTLALDKDGNTYSWGNNEYNKLGRSTNDNPKLANIPKAKQVAAGSNHSFILLD